MQRRLTCDEGAGEAMHEGLGRVGAVGRAKCRETPTSLERLRMMTQAKPYIRCPCDLVKYIRLWGASVHWESTVQSVG